MKNLAKFKVAVRTREYLIQAIFQLLFNNENKDNILQQFEDEHSTKKVDFENFNKALTTIDETKDSLSLVLHEELELKKSECKFEYRSSIFKSKLKGKTIITSVQLILTKSKHNFNIDYKDLKDNLSNTKLTVKKISDEKNS